MDSISLDHIRLRGYHGVLPQESVVGNWFTFSLKVYLDLSLAAATDDVTTTVNYADLYRIVVEENAQPSKLLEHLAGRILSRIEAEFSPEVKEAEIDVRKVTPPFKAHMQGATIHLHRIYSK